jgi:ubiquinone/menaquinone biosynthesis C-methylase UbiE
MLAKEHWEKKHKESEGRYNRVTDFARLSYYNFMKNKKKASVLDLCSGKGADSIFFHNKGLKVTSVDYSNEAIRQFNETQKRYEIFISSFVKDITEPLPFGDENFDYVYTRLGLYYFTDEELKKILPEIRRVLKSEGLLIFQVKSTNDKEYGKGKEIEKDMFEDETGYVRHYFSKEYTEELLKEFTIVMIEERKAENGGAYLEVVAEKK